MAFPVIESTATYQSNSTSTNPHPVTLPSGIASGDLLIMILRCGSTATATTPTGWTLLSSRSSSGVSYIWYKVASGSEGSTVNVTTSTGIRCAAITYRISGAAETPEASFASTNVNNPPSLSASWGDRDNLFLAVLTNRRSDSTVTAAPTDYSNLLTISQASNTGTTRSRVSSASRLLSSASDDPGAFSTSGTIDNPHSATIVIGGTVDSTSQHVYIALSPHVSSGGENTTAVLPAPQGKSTSQFVAGVISDDANVTGNISFTDDSYTEIEWSLALGAELEEDDVLQFRLVSGTDQLDEYLQTPQITIALSGDNNVSVGDSGSALDSGLGVVTSVASVDYTNIQELISGANALPVMNEALSAITASQILSWLSALDNGIVNENSPNFMIEALSVDSIATFDSSNINAITTIEAYGEFVDSFLKTVAVLIDDIASLQESVNWASITATIETISSVVDDAFISASCVLDGSDEINGLSDALVSVVSLLLDNGNTQDIVSPALSITNILDTLESIHAQSVVANVALSHTGQGVVTIEINGSFSYEEQSASNDVVAATVTLEITSAISGEDAIHILYESLKQVLDFGETTHIVHPVTVQITRSEQVDGNDSIVAAAAVQVIGASSTSDDILVRALASISSVLHGETDIYIFFETLVSILDGLFGADETSSQSYTVVASNASFTDNLTPKVVLWVNESIFSQEEIIHGLIVAVADQLLSSDFLHDVVIFVQISDVAQALSALSGLSSFFSLEEQLSGVDASIYFDAALKIITVRFHKQAGRMASKLQKPSVRWEHAYSSLRVNIKQNNIRYSIRQGEIQYD